MRPVPKSLSVWDRLCDDGHEKAKLRQPALKRLAKSNLPWVLGEIATEYTNACEPPPAGDDSSTCSGSVFSDDGPSLDGFDWDLFDGKSPRPPKPEPVLPAVPWERPPTPARRARAAARLSLLPKEPTALLGPPVGPRLAEERALQAEAHRHRVEHAAAVEAEAERRREWIEHRCRELRLDNLRERAVRCGAEASRAYRCGAQRARWRGEADRAEKADEVRLKVLRGVANCVW